MQYLDFRCRIVNYRTNEVDIAKLLEAIYDCKWDKRIHNSTMVGGYQVRYPYLEELCNNEMKKFMDEVLVDTVQQYCMQEYAVGPGEEKFGLPPISIDLTDYWINVMPPGSYQRIHSHFTRSIWMLK